MTAFELHHGTYCRCGAWRGALGLEPTPALYVEHIVDVFREVRRVLRSNGTLWLNLGDSYITAPHGDGDTHDPKWPGGRDRSAERPNRSGPRIGHRSSFRRDRREREDEPHRPAPGLKPKDLVMIPARVALALQADGWWLRSDVIWSKPNPMPESVQDRPTTSHEHVFLLAKSERYYFDADAISEPISGGAHSRGANDAPTGWQVGNGSHRELLGRYRTSGNLERKPRPGADPYKQQMGSVPWEGSRRNKRSVWEIPTQPYPDAHFATFPEDLVKPCVLAGCPEGGTVLDPFAGAGTVLYVAKELGRQAIGAELGAPYCDLIVERVRQDVLPLSFLAPLKRPGVGRYYEEHDYLAYHPRGLEVFRL